MELFYLSERKLNASLPHFVAIHTILYPKNGFLPYCNQKNEFLPHYNQKKPMKQKIPMKHYVMIFNFTHINFFMMCTIQVVGLF